MVVAKSGPYVRRDMPSQQERGANRVLWRSPSAGYLIRYRYLQLPGQADCHQAREQLPVTGRSPMPVSQRPSTGWLLWDPGSQSAVRHHRGRLCNGGRPLYGFNSR